MRKKVETRSLVPRKKEMRRPRLDGGLMFGVETEQLLKTTSQDKQDGVL